MGAKENLQDQAVDRKLSKDDDSPGRARIAVVGGGIAGLAAAYRLGQRHQVTVYEKHDSPGLAIHGVTGVGNGERVDIPLRVFTEGHYRNLLALYGELGIETQAIDNSCSYTLANDPEPLETFLKYGVGPEGTSEENVATTPFGRALLSEHASFVHLAACDLQAGHASGKSLGAYLFDCGASEAYVQSFVLPSFAGICTCSIETAEAFPADIALELLLSGMLRLGLRRARGGAARAARAFLARLSDFRGATAVRRVIPGDDGVQVIDAHGGQETYDHVVVATQANQVHKLVDLDRRERAALSSVHYERVRVVVHRDASLLPSPKSLSAFNFVVDRKRRRTSATIWLNAMQPELTEPVFQSVNPLRDPAPESVLRDIVLERAAVSAYNAEIGSRIEALHQQPGRRVWFCGSYAARGVPLLETGVASANAVCRMIDGRCAPPATGPTTSSQDHDAAHP